MHKMFESCCYNQAQKSWFQLLACALTYRKTPTFSTETKNYLLHCFNKYLQVPCN